MIRRIILEKDILINLVKPEPQRNAAPAASAPNLQNSIFTFLNHIFNNYSDKRP
jgi:hypothetical protein